MSIAANKIPIHVSVDLETRDLRASSAVVSVGLAAFTVAGGLVGTTYMVLDSEQQIKDGRTKCQSVDEWWQRQDPKVKEAMNDPLMVLPKIGLGFITQFFARFQNNTYRIAGVWGYGSDFDNAILLDMFAHYNMPPPWEFKVNRCGRTLVNLAGVAAPPPHGRKHNALDDAIFQAQWFQKAMLSMKVVNNG